jgi:hypothetical protein
LLKLGIEGATQPSHLDFENSCQPGIKGEFTEATSIDP